MEYTGTRREQTFEAQVQELRKRIPRIDEFVDCADWEIGRDFKRFPIAFSTGTVDVRVWRSNSQDDADLPVIEIAYYYNSAAERSCFLQIREVPILDE